MRFPFLFNGRGIAMRFLPSATFGATGSSRTLHVLTEFSEENLSLELGGEFGPGMEGWERSEQDFAEQKTKR